jgi:hypothetical protein
MRNRVFVDLIKRRCTGLGQALHPMTGNLVREIRENGYIRQGQKLE